MVNLAPTLYTPFYTLLKLAESKLEPSCLETCFCNISIIQIIKMNSLSVSFVMFGNNKTKIRFFFTNKFFYHQLLKKIKQLVKFMYSGGMSLTKSINRPNKKVLKH